MCQLPSLSSASHHHQLPSTSNLSSCRACFKSHRKQSGKDMHQLLCGSQIPTDKKDEGPHRHTWGKLAPSATLQLLENSLHRWRNLPECSQKHRSWQLAHTKDCVLKSNSMKGRFYTVFSFISTSKDIINQETKIKQAEV